MLLLCFKSHHRIANIQLPCFFIDTTQILVSIALGKLLRTPYWGNKSLVFLFKCRKRSVSHSQILHKNLEFIPTGGTIFDHLPQWMNHCDQCSLYQGMAEFGLNEVLCTQPVANDNSHFIYTAWFKPNPNSSPEMRSAVPPPTLHTGRFWVTGKRKWEIVTWTFYVRGHDKCLRFK